MTRSVYKRSLLSYLGQLGTSLGQIPLFWRIQIISWMALGVLTLPLKGAVFGSFYYAVLITLYREPLGFLLTSGFRVIFGRLGLIAEEPVRAVCHVVPLSIVAALLDVSLGWWLFDHLLNMKTRQSVVGMFSIRMVAYASWSLAYFWIKGQMIAHQGLLELIRAETAARDSEILMLRAQVSPHFLFNAFNAILADLERQPLSLIPVVQGLSDYFRYSLTSRQEMFVSLGEEFDAMINYLTVERARFRDSLIIECDIDPSVRRLLVPGIFLQPLIENALKFGHQTSPTPRHLRLSVTATSDGGAQVDVSNSGDWISPLQNRMPDNIGGCGLSNLSRRLVLLYGRADLLQIPERATGGMVIVSIRFPGDYPHPLLKS